MTKTETQVTFRKGTPADGQAVVDLHASAIRELGITSYTSDQVESWSASLDPDGYPFEEEGVHFVIAERGEEMVGFGELQLDSGEVAAVYVHPDHARTGVGRSILARLETTALQAGHESTVLTASKNAVPFYERMGYEVRESVDYESAGGLVLECMKMRKSSLSQSVVTDRTATTCSKRQMK